MINWMSNLVNLETRKKRAVQGYLVSVFLHQLLSGLSTFAGRRCSHRPGFPSILWPSLRLSFLFQIFANQARRLWTKTKSYATTVRTGTRDSNIQDGEDVDVLRSPELNTKKNFGSVMNSKSKYILISFSNILFFH